MNVSIRKISNGYIVTLPPSGGPAPSAQKEVAVRNLDEVDQLLRQHFDPVQALPQAG